MGFLLSVASGALEGAAMEREGHRKESELVLQEQMAALRDMWKGQGAARAKAAQQQALIEDAYSRQVAMGYKGPKEVIANIVMSGNETSIKDVLERPILMKGPKAVDETKLAKEPPPPGTLEQTINLSSGMPPDGGQNEAPASFGERAKIGLFGRAPDPNNFDKAIDMFSKTVPGSDPASVRNMITKNQEPDNVLFAKPGVSYTFGNDREQLHKNLTLFKQHYKEGDFKDYAGYQWAMEASMNDPTVDFMGLLKNPEQKMREHAKQVGMDEAARLAQNYSDGMFVDSKTGETVYGRVHGGTSGIEIQDASGKWVKAEPNRYKKMTQSASTSEVRGPQLTNKIKLQTAESNLKGLHIMYNKLEKLHDANKGALGWGGATANFVNDLRANTESMLELGGYERDLIPMEGFARSLQERGKINAEAASIVTQLVYGTASVLAGQDGRDLSNSDVDRAYRMLGVSEKNVGDPEQLLAAAASALDTATQIQSDKGRRFNLYGGEKGISDDFYDGAEGKGSLKPKPRTLDKTGTGGEPPPGIKQTDNGYEVDINDPNAVQEMKKMLDEMPETQEITVNGDRLRGKKKAQ